MLWQRTSSQSPCGVRMLIKCNHRNPRGLAPGSSQSLQQRQFPDFREEQQEDEKRPKKLYKKACSSEKKKKKK